MPIRYALIRPIIEHAGLLTKRKDQDEKHYPHCN
nr:MAG TPA: hypothetical protein [Caudoviricetes sp.]